MTLWIKTPTKPNCHITITRNKGMHRTPPEGYWAFINPRGIAVPEIF